MQETDITIIGAGVAGLSAALYASRAGTSVTVIDEMGTGGQLLQIDMLENYPGVYPAVNGTDFALTLTKQAKEFGSTIVQDSITDIRNQEDKFIVKTKKEEYKSKALIVATGAEHKKLSVPGEKELTGLGVSYCAVCDGPFFRKKEVTIIGGGDTACTEALYLANLANHVNIVHRRDAFRATQALVDRIKENPKISIILNSVAKQINGTEKVESITLKNTQDNSETEIKTDAVFVCVGMEPRTHLFEELQKDKSGYIVTKDNMESSVSGLFIAGDLRAKPLRQVVTAASDGAIAGFSAAEYVKADK